MYSLLIVLTLCVLCANAKVASINRDDVIPPRNINKDKSVTVQEDGFIITKIDDKYIIKDVKYENNHDPRIKIDLPVINLTNYTNSAYETVNETEINESTEKVVSNHDAAKPLLLTPLIEQGETNLARRLSKVDPTLFLGLASHSGFLTVDEKYNSNLFFWYFPVPEKPVAETPWIIWLQGGPGASSMVGLFAEIGPVRVDNEQLKFNNETWGKSHSLLFIDNPVGTGYSFTNSSEGYAKYTNVSSVQLYSALQQFLQVFPELRTAPLYIAGESYAGKYIPGLAREIHRRRSTNQSINLQGLAIGNGFVEASSVANYSRIAYHFGIIDKDGKKHVEEMEQEYMQRVNSGDGVAAKKQWQNIVFTLQFTAMQKQMYNVLMNDIDILHQFPQFLERDDVKRAIHVGSTELSYVNMSVNTAMAPDFVSNYRPVLEELLENYRVLMYNGHLDMMIPYVISAENIHTWRWSGRQEFLEAERNPWLIDNKLAGYHKSGGNLTEVMVRNAGHTVPTDQPAAAKVMMESFTSNRPLKGRSVVRPFTKMLSVMERNRRGNNPEAIIYL